MAVETLLKTPVSRSKSSKGSRVSKASDKRSWMASMSRRSVSRVHSSFSLHTRVAHVLAEDRRDALDPNSRVCTTWSQLLLLLILTETFVLPYLLAFDPVAMEKVSLLFVLVASCEGFFALDLFVQAHTGYYWDGNLIRDKQDTRRRYLCSRQFALDLVAILPGQALVLVCPGIVLKTMFLKLARWSRLPQLLLLLDELYAKNFVVLKLLKVLVSTLYVAHILACVRHSFGYDESGRNLWLPQTPRPSESLLRDYLAALFWSVGIMTGYFEGEIPRHISEFLFTILVALCGFSMFVTMCATIFVISKCQSGNTEAVEARINQLVHVLSFHRVPEYQQMKAIEYLQRYYTDAESTDRDTAKILCPSIANDIQVELLKSTIARVPIFDGCSDRFIVAITSLLEMVAVPAQTTLISPETYGHAMYVVGSGVLAILVQSVSVQEIRKGSCFGELFVFSSVPCRATVISATYAILYKLSRFHCERVLQGYPDCAGVIAGHVNYMLRKANSTKDNNTSEASSSTSSTPAGSSRALKSRRSSRASRVLTETSNLVKSLSRRRSSVRPWLARKSFINPTELDIPRSKGAHMYTGSYLREITTELMPSLTSETPTGSSTPFTTTTRLPHQQSPAISHVHSHQAMWRLLLFRRCIDHQSRTRMWWLLLLLSNMFYCWLMVPVQITFPLWQRPTMMTQTTDTISNAGLFVDIILNLNLSYTADSDKIMDPMVTAQRYVKGELFFDLLCAFPYEYLYMERYPLMRLPRLLRVWRLERYLKEIACFVCLSSRRQLFLLGLLFFIICHVVTCIHFGVSYIEGFSPNDKKAWISPASLCLRRLNATHLDNCNGTIFDESVNRVKLDAITAMEYFRSHYVAVGVFTSPGNSVEPTSSLQLIVALLFMLGGFLISAIIVDNVQKRFTASAFEQKEFFETSSRIRRFLRRQNVPILIHHRVKSFLDYWWSAHRGAVISGLLADLPRSIRLELLQSICTPILQTLKQLQGLHSASQSLDEILVENAKFVLYGQSETIYRHGDYATGIYFLLEGEISIVKMGGTPCEVPRGGVFGAAALIQQERGEGYTEHVSATSGCILLFVSRDQVQAMETIFPGFNAELLSYGQRLLSKKRSDRSISTFQDGTPDVQARQRAMNELIRRPKFTDLIHDPDSTLALLWETWIFVVMTVQWVLITFQMCFPLGDEHKTADGLMLFMETAFVLDLFVRSRLGFYEYGNKVMELQRIKQRYLKSGTFAMDIVALIPLYVVNWEVPARYRWNLINVNKLLRLFKIPRQLQALETRYLKLTTELHLFKLLYYTFMLSHFLACLWFNFASKAAVSNLSSTVTAFGNDAWLPGKNLEKSSLMLQYMASLYWSFGLMSSSGNSAFPQTTAQSIFSVATMASGFFLFAYVVGNFTDIIDLISSEVRDFNAKMGAVRQMLDHFAMADDLQERVKTFLLFKRHHTITEEHVLVHCLPPSLLTDIRLVYMKPMIDKVEFLTGMESSVTRMLVSQFQQVLVSRGEFVFKLGESGSDMFFVFTGVLHVLLPSRVANPTKTTFKIVAEILAGRMEVVDGALNHAGPQEDDIIAGMKHKSVKDELKKVNEVSDGSYFGENGLFTNKKRDAYIQAHTSCILYRLSRESLELVFDRYPKWKQKVLRIANIHREQARLIHLSRKEQRLGLTAAASMLSRSDIMNWHAESLKELRHHTHLQRINDRSSPSLVYRTIIKTLSRLYDYALHGVEVQSQCHLFWLRFVVSCTAYVSILIPYELTMDPMDRVSTVTTLAKLCELLCEIVFALDVWFSWHIRESPDAMELYDENLRSSYRKERLYWDLIAAIPIYDMLSLFKCSPWFKMLRCAKILNMKRYLDELNRRSVASEIMRFSHVSILYLLVIYWSACAYLAVATRVGFASDWEDWLPSQELQLEDPLNPSSKRLALRLLRGLSFAVTTIVKKTYIPTPTTALVFLFHIVMSFIGLLVMSFVIGELASLFISYIDLEVGFRKNCIAVELYLRRLRVSEQLKARTAAFMTSLWSSHAGVNYEELLAEMPCDIRAACVLHVSKKPLDWFVMKVATPLCWEGDECTDALALSLAKRLRFESYPRDENVVAEGSVVRAMYFVIKGYLKMESRSLIHRPLGLRDGSYFGERGLLACTISAYNVRTVRACDLLSLSSEAFAQVLNKYPFSRLALKLCDAAYKLMKTQNIASCSKPDMEDHWGAALLSLLQSIRDQRLETFAVSDRAGISTDADASFTASAVVLNGDLSALSTVWSPERSATFDASGASTTIKESGDQGMQQSDDTPAKRPEFMTLPSVIAEWGELPAHIDEMFEALDTAQCCFEAFAPLLHILLATDPLDWKASFGAPSSAKIAAEA